LASSTPQEDGRQDAGGLTAAPGQTPEKDAGGHGGQVAYTTLVQGPATVPTFDGGGSSGEAAHNGSPYGPFLVARDALVNDRVARNFGEPVQSHARAWRRNIETAHPHARAPTEEEPEAGFGGS
jgi:hypothetical protein